MSRLKTCLGLLLALTLVGCAQPPKKQAYNQAAATHIKKLVIAHDPDQDRYEAVLLGHPAMGFGLVGGLIAAADMQTKGTRLTEALVPAETRLQQRLGEAMTQGLNRIGYEPTLVVLPKDTKEDDMLAQAKGKGPAGDAVLTLRMSGRYVAAGPSSDYFPYLHLKAVLTDAASGQVLYEDIFTYGYTLPGAPTVHFAADPRFRFGDIDALVADPAKTREGLVAGLDLIVAQVAADLKRQ